MPAAPRPADAGARPSGLLGHPLTLLVCGFLLTGLLGGALTTYWQSREWDRQRRHLARELELNQKVALFEETTTAVAETFTSAEDILYMFTFASGLKRQEDLAERIGFWKIESRKWRTRSKVLSAKLDATFVDRRISSTFHEVINERRLLGNDIANLLDHLSEKGLAATASQENQKQVREDLKLVNQATGAGGKLSQLVALLRAEIKAASYQED